LGALFCSIF